MAETKSLATLSKTRLQKEALLERAMNSRASGPSEPKSSVLWVFINDFTDSDNQAAALVWAKFLAKHPDLKGIYIAEPRHVDLGYYTTSKDFGQIISLVGRLRPKLESGDEPIKTVLAGKLTEDDIDNSTIDDSTANGRPLTKDERNLLQRCIKPDKNKDELRDAKADAIRHAELLIMDFLSTMKTDGQPAFDAYIDRRCLREGLESPINLKTHYHEELVFRTAEELTEFEKIKDKEIPLSDKAKELRTWYKHSIDRKLRDFENIKPWQDLQDYQVLFDEMRQKDRVIVFGGCSLTILKELLKQDDSLSRKVEYYQQGGTFNPKLNILGNPLNFALNLDAAEFVFKNAERLAKFRLIPTDTTKKLEYSLQGLTKWSAPIGLHSLGFYGKVDIWDLKDRTPEEQHPSASTQDIIRWRSNLIFNDSEYTDPSFRAYKVVMADLSAYLISFTDAFKEYKCLQGVLKSYELGVKSTTNGNKMKLEVDEDSSVKALMLTLPQGQDVILVEDTLNLINTAIETGSSSFKASPAVGTKEIQDSAGR
ncbi:hypothetical protein N0V93_005301 [Gnomoniopsis smithogilvyi]|uniref:Uncharacterized protein n=1 Tax=Gnomoniopsis smithogilvyi TaxID=1191159 RepID=A0A9W9CWL7_9PEZI|nr:hypothetical protein N0V93_005301 [Gnomoniopsis smithogilvyi]